MAMTVCERSLERAALFANKSSPQTEFALSIQNTNCPHQCNCEIIMLNVMKCWNALDIGMLVRGEESGQIILPSTRGAGFDQNTVTMTVRGNILIIYHIQGTDVVFLQTSCSDRRAVLLSHQHD